MYKFYTLELRDNDKIDKTFIIIVGGRFTKEESDKYLEEFSRRLAFINPPEYYLIIDSQNLQVTDQNLLSYEGKAFELIDKTTFKKKYHIIPKSIVTTIQEKRLSKDFDNSKIIEVQSYDEIIKQRLQKGYRS